MLWWQWLILYMLMAVPAIHHLLYRRAIHLPDLDAAVEQHIERLQGYYARDEITLMELESSIQALLQGRGTVISPSSSVLAATNQLPKVRGPTSYPIGDLHPPPASCGHRRPQTKDKLTRVANEIEEILPIALHPVPGLALDYPWIAAKLAKGLDPFPTPNAGRLGCEGIMMQSSRRAPAYKWALQALPYYELKCEMEDRRRQRKLELHEVVEMGSGEVHEFYA